MFHFGESIIAPRIYFSIQSNDNAFEGRALSRIYTTSTDSKAIREQKNVYQ